MKEITSKKTGRIQIVSEETWGKIIYLGWEKKYKVRDLVSRTIRDIPQIPGEIEIKKINKPKKTKKNE
jgi:hypothetical protein